MDDEGLIEFEVGGEAVEVEVEGFELEWRIEPEGKHRRINSRKGRVPAIIWESNRTSTLQHPRRDFAEISTAPTSAPCICSRTFCEGSGRRVAGEVGHVNSDGGSRI